MIKLFKYFIQAIIVYLFYLIAKLIGLSLSRKIFSFLFKNIGPYFKAKDIVEKNLLRFSKKISNDRKREIIKNMWSNYGMTFIEYIFLKKFRNSNSHIAIKGKENLNKILEESKPVIFISGHFANFELMSMEITKKKINLATIYRPLNNFFLNPFMLYQRKKYVCSNQIKKGRSGVKEAVNYLRKNYSIALMIDQRLSEGEQVKFFGEEALTTTLPAQLALKFNIKIVPISLKRNNDNFFEMNVHEPIETSTLSSKTGITEKLNEILEKMIISNPDQWIWTHNRWK